MFWDSNSFLLGVSPSLSEKQNGGVGAGLCGHWAELTGPLPTEQKHRGPGPKPPDGTVAILMAGEFQDGALTKSP